MPLLAPTGRRRFQEHSHGQGTSAVALAESMFPFCLSVSLHLMHPRPGPFLREERGEVAMVIWLRNQGSRKYILFSVGRVVVRWYVISFTIGGLPKAISEACSLSDDRGGGLGCVDSSVQLVD